MSFDTSNLAAYVELHSKSISTKAVGNAQTAKLLIDSGNVQVGVKGSAPVLKMDVDVTFQDGSTCGRTASGSAVLSEAIITVKPIKDVQNFCPKTLYNTHYSFALKAGQDPEGELDTAFAQYVMDMRAGKISEQVEQLLWQGDTSLSSGNLKYINGILKQASTGTAGTNYTNIDSTKTTVLEQLQEAYSKMPVKARKAADFRIFVGEDLYDSYIADLAKLNIFKPVEDTKLYGTSAVLVPTAGLNGTYKIVATRLSNLQLGLDLESDFDKASLRFSQESEQVYMDFHFSVGVAVIYSVASEIGYADLSPA